mmetsp:Transcript_24801/g.69639  ORF Transcript_24801/g.69639 Transcript_24801/m.69639 type:complete len:337 (+) Transcript_24801:77-1087(+)
MSEVLAGVFAFSYAASQSTHTHTHTRGLLISLEANRLALQFRLILQPTTRPAFAVKEELVKGTSLHTVTIHIVHTHVVTARLREARLRNGFGAVAMRHVFVHHNIIAIEFPCQIDAFVVRLEDDLDELLVGRALGGLVLLAQKFCRRHDVDETVTVFGIAQCWSEILRSLSQRTVDDIIRCSRVLALEQRHGSGHVRRRVRCSARVSVSVIYWSHGDDASTGSREVDLFVEIRKAGSFLIAVGGANGSDVVVRRRIILDVLSVVASGCDEEDSRVPHLSVTAMFRQHEATATDAHVDDGGTVGLTILCCSDDVGSSGVSLRVPNLGHVDRDKRRDA